MFVDVPDGVLGAYEWPTRPDGKYKIATHIAQSNCEPMVALLIHVDKHFD